MKKKSAYKVTIEWEDVMDAPAKRSYYDMVTSIGGVYNDKFVVLHFADDTMLMLKKELIKAIRTSWEV